MNPEDKAGEKQWQRETWGTEGRQMAPTLDSELDIVRDGDGIALFDGDAIDAGHEAWVRSDTTVDIGESQ